ncbi:methyltransferase TRM13-domain-containing protein [Phycomyces blakesleeanus]
MQTRCNARPKEQEQFYSLNVNCTLALTQEELDFQKTIQSHKNMYSLPWIARIQLSKLQKEDMRSVAEKVEKVYKEYVPKIEQVILTNPATASPRTAERFVKHLDQQSSLLGHMVQRGMLDDKKACFVEFGAGRGELSGFLKKALDEKNGEATYVLVDRKNVKSKLDPFLKGTDATHSVVQRVLIDIKDLDLSKVQALMNENQEMKKVVVLSKHLCGSATDITLKCLMNYVTNQREAGNLKPISGIIIALCCHQLCRYEMYPNHEYLKQTNISRVEFDRLSKMSSWATSGPTYDPKKSITETENVPLTEEEEEELADHADAGQEEGDADQTSNHYSGWDSSEREKIGYECKRVLDAGRMRYLQEHGFKVELVYYVDPKTSLENCALIATPE